MKKLLILLLSVIFAFALAACTDKQSAEENTGANNTENTGENPEIPDSGDVGDNEDAKTDASYEVMYVQNGDMKIFGKLYVPENAKEKMPAVILSHSAGLTADSLSSYCLGFAERGYVAFAFDFCGGSSKSRSDGNEEDMTVFSEVSDLEAVLLAVKQLDIVDENEIYLFGTSQGGLVSALTAEEFADGLSGIILLYPAFNIAELAQSSADSSFGGFDLSNIDWSNIMNSFSNIDFSALMEIMSGGIPTTTTGEAFTQTLLGYDVYEHIGNFKGRVLILHGSDDFIVPSSYSEQAAEIYEDCELHLIDGAGHGFNSENYSITGNYDDQAWAFIDSFLATCS